MIPIGKRPEGTYTVRKLYGALEGVTIDDSVPITINTLENAIFLDRINDISFEVGDKLVILIEHQSTINPNMPLRSVTNIYQKFDINGKSGGRAAFFKKKSRS
jgi:hypothetical protein